MALIDKAYPADKINNLKAGDFFLEGRVTKIAGGGGFLKVFLESPGSDPVIYTAHHCQCDHCTLYRRDRYNQFEKRRIRRKEYKAEIRKMKEQGLL
jgi:hypothetical protein